jgi:hypothetical protein
MSRVHGAFTSPASPEGWDRRAAPVSHSGVHVGRSKRLRQLLPGAIVAELVPIRSWSGCERVRTGRRAEETELDMSTSAQVPTTPATERQPIWKHGIAAAVVASVATTVLAAVASAAGVSFADRTGASIPTAGFAQLTLVFSLVGVGIAAVMARKARRPRPTFVRTALALLALSYVPDLTFGFNGASAATLITLHTVAAAIVVPTLAGRLARTR